MRFTGKGFCKPKKLVGKPAPDFELSSIDGKGKIKTKGASIPLRYKVTGVPTDVIVDADGIARYYQGRFIEKEVRKALDEVLKR